MELLSSHESMLNGIKRRLIRIQLVVQSHVHCTEREARGLMLFLLLICIGHAIRIVNGGSSATLPQTVADGSVTELTVGGAFLCPTRCDYLPLDLKPAVFFVAPVCRIPDGEHVVVRGAGATGVAASPVFPDGLRMVQGSHLWSHQTPLSVRGGAPAIGSPVVFRPERVAPIFDRFEELLLLGSDSIAERATTFRGIGIGHQ